MILAEVAHNIQGVTYSVKYTMQFDVLSMLVFVKWKGVNLSGSGDPVA